MPRSLRIFVPSAAALLTDSAGHGEGLIAWSLLRGLAERGHELVVCARRAELGAAPPFELVETSAASRFESVEPLAYAQRAGRVLELHGGARSFDVIHWLFPAEPAEALFAPPPTTPYLIGPQFEPWPSRHRAWRAGDVVRAAAGPVFSTRRRAALERADLLLCATPGAVLSLPAEHRHKGRLLPPGVDVTRFEVTPPATEPRILFVGKLEAEKGVPELVAAFAAVRRELPDATLTIAGDGPLRPDLADRAQPGVELLGPVQYDDVPALHAASAVFCLPSRGEPFGMAVVEAMAAGRAVVAVDAGGPRGLVDRELGGRLVPPNDVAALTEALLDLLSSRDRLAELGRFNRARAERELAIEPVLDRLEALYGEAMSSEKAA